jgi:hypothetical protein
MREQVKGAGHAIGNSMMGDDAAAPLLAAALRAPVPGWQVFDGGAAPKWMRLGTGATEKRQYPGVSVAGTAPESVKKDLRATQPRRSRTPSSRRTARPSVKSPFVFGRMSREPF